MRQLYQVPVSEKEYVGEEVRRFGASEIAQDGQKVEGKEPSRTADQPDEETQRGKEHVEKSGEARKQVA